jgi:hypothetical protein
LDLVESKKNRPASAIASAIFSIFVLAASQR